ncbi:MAG: secretion system protein [Gammaproteobacteria bacterium]|nr:MAG: secretion system protein [Gammaproteobacteria bacterium]RLA51555.1 MAG: secretion system protein [Gammaproteobacteria bacterium]
MFGLEFSTVFLGMIAIAVFLLSQAFLVPTFGENRKARKRMDERLRGMASMDGTARKTSLVRKKYLTELSPLEQRLEALPGMDNLGKMIEQAGKETLAYRFVLTSLVIGAIAAAVAMLFTNMGVVAVLSGLGVGALPFLRLSRARSARLGKFEEQLPDALGTMSRALKAGYPFSETLKLVAEDLEEPVAKEFEITFNDVNYGGDLRVALEGLLVRVPSVTVMALVSAVMIQKETGGNLAELLDKLASVIRGRYKFQRKVKTLSAEGRMAAWVMSLFPFFIGGVLSIANPDLMPMLIYDPLGQKLIIGAFILMVIGIFWMQHIVRLDI